MYTLFAILGLMKIRLTRLGYYTNPKAVASVVLAWPGVVGTIAGYVYPAILSFSVDVANNYNSTIILWLSHKHDDESGPKSNYGRSLENDGSETEPKPV